MPTKIEKKGFSLTMAVIAAVLSVMAGLYFANYWQQKKDKAFIEQFNGTLLTNAREIGEFNFTSTNGTPFTNASLKGHWSLLFFGFTNCPEMCPTTMTKLSKMYKALEKSHATLPQVVMVSIDGKRDKMPVLKNYVESFDKHFIGARADASAINAMTKELGVVHMKEAAKNGNQKNYNIQHSGAVMIVNPQGHLAGFFSLPYTAEKLATDFVRLTASSVGTA